MRAAAAVERRKGRFPPIVFPAGTIAETRNVWKALGFFALFCTLTQDMYEFKGVNFQTDGQLSDKHFLGVQWEKGQINTVNAILVLLFMPLACMDSITSGACAGWC